MWQKRYSLDGSRHRNEITVWDSSLVVTKSLRALFPVLPWSTLVLPPPPSLLPTQSSNRLAGPARRLTALVSLQQATRFSLYAHPYYWQLVPVGFVEVSGDDISWPCVHACVRARVRARVCVCVCVCMCESCTQLCLNPC